MFVSSSQVESLSEAINLFKNHKNGPLSFVINEHDRAIHLFNPFLFVVVTAYGEIQEWKEQKNAEYEHETYRKIYEAMEQAEKDNKKEVAFALKAILRQMAA